MEHLWGWFSELYTGEPLTWSEIHAWSEVSGVRPTMQEALALRAMAAEAERVASEALKQQAKNQTK